MADCPDCGLPAIFGTEEYQRGTLCYAHSELWGGAMARYGCKTRTVERLNSQLTQAQAEIAALREVVEAADILRGYHVSGLSLIHAREEFDDARAKLSLRDISTKREAAKPKRCTMADCILGHGHSGKCHDGY